MPYADVNGLHLYYDEHGEGPQLVLLHVGLMTIELNVGVALPALAEHRRVIAVELHGHGRTADVAVLPGTTHMDITRSALLAPVIETFLA
jgi:pimeloyl-ACP methyl ester carboxylesterase